jgi:hypothetical protein
MNRKVKEFSDCLGVLLLLPTKEKPRAKTRGY